MDKVKNQLLNFILPIIVLLAVLFIFIPYFTSDFLDLRQQQENQEMERRFLEEELVRLEKEKEERRKNYLTGRFDPAVRADFVLIPAEYTFYEEGKGAMYLRKEAYAAYLDMYESAKADSIDLKIVSAARNFDYQKNIWDKKWTGVTPVGGENLAQSKALGEKERFLKILEYSAAPGTSRHHWGTEIDINGVNPPYFNSEKGKKEYAWLVENAGSFGFCQTYDEKGRERPTGYNEEKWHWSYMPLARNLLLEYKYSITDDDIRGFLGEEHAPSLNLISDYVLSINPDCL